MTGTTQIIWKRRNGEWALYGPADTIREGSTVTVTKRSGKTSQEHIVEVHRAASVDGVKMAYGLPGIDIEAEERRIREANERRQREGCQVMPFCAGTCRDEAEHDAFEAARRTQLATPQRPRSGMCDQCGQRRGIIPAHDMSGIPGKVCQRCNRDGDLSFA